VSHRSGVREIIYMFDKDLKVSERERLASIVDSSEDAILSKTMEGIITSWNSGAEELYGYKADEVIGKHVSILIPYDQLDEIPQLMRRLANGEVIGHYETLRKRKNGSLIDVALTISPMRDEKGNIVGASAVARNITLEKRLRAERQFLGLIVEGSDDAIYSKDLNGIVLSWNPGAEKIFGYTPEEIIGKPVAMLTAPGNENQVPEILSQLKAGNRIEHFETQRKRKDGTLIHVSLTISPVKDDSGNIIAASSIAKDITKQKQAAMVIQAQLQEKQILLQEIHHRVKNNLQLVASLLELRSRGLDNQAAKAAFADSIGRIRSMAMLHEKMYGSNIVGSVNFGEYIRSLFEPLAEAFNKDLPINFVVDSDHFMLDLNRAIPLGLILNELLTNSVKHAFSSSKPPEIRVKIRTNMDKVAMIVADNGTGLPPDVDLFKSHSFGFKIVRLLIEQIDGQIEVQNSNGTVYQITLPYEVEKNVT
jgi:PAS domain S-box-containing protein